MTTSRPTAANVDSAATTKVTSAPNRSAILGAVYGAITPANQRTKL